MKMAGLFGDGSLLRKITRNAYGKGEECSFFGIKSKKVTVDVMAIFQFNKS